MKTPSHRQALPLGLALALLLAACQAPPTAGDPAATPSAGAGAVSTGPLGPSLMGRVVLGQPVAKATLKVYSLQGELLAEHAQATNAQGVFNVAAPVGVADFRVEAVAPEGAPALQQGTAAAEVRGFTASNNLVYLDPVTTVISQRTKQQPDESLASIESKARVAFQVHPESKLGFDLDEPDAFDEAGFMTQAASQGGFSAHVSNTARLLGQAGAPAMPMAPLLGAASGKEKDLSDEFFDAVEAGIKKKAKGAALKLALTAGKALAKQAEGTPVLGWVLNTAVGLASDDDKTGAKLSAIQNELKEQRKMLEDITYRLQGISEDVQAVRDALAAFAARTNRQQLELNYNSAVDGVVRSQFATINAFHTKLRLHTLVDPTDWKHQVQQDPKREAMRKEALARDKQELEALRADILREVPAIYENLFSVETQAAAGGSSALSRWTLLAATKSPKYPLMLDEAFIQDLHAQIEFFETYQVRALLLLLEAYHMGVPDAAKSQFYYDEVMRKIDAQRKSAYVPDVTGVLVSPRFGLMWPTGILAPDGGKPSETTFTYDRPNNRYTPKSPQQAMADRKLAGFTDWRLPTVAEFVTISGEANGAVNYSNMTMAGFTYPRDNTNVPRIITADTQGAVPIVYMVDGGRAVPMGSGVCSILPVRSVPVLKDN